MIRLKVPIISNEVFLNKLIHKNICTVNDFLQKKSSDIQDTTCLSCKEVTKLKDNIIVQCSSPFLNGHEIYLNESLLSYKTGILRFDNLLGGGLFGGRIYELCGPSACGKTQLCFSMLLYIIISTKKDITFIDTRNKFSVYRIKQILKNKYRILAQQEINAILKKIKVHSVSDIYSLITCIHNLKQNSELVLVIDSLSALYLSFIGFYKNNGLCYMNHISSILNYLCKKKATIVVTNLAVKNCDFTSKMIEDIYDQHTEHINFKPAIGKYWFHIPNTRLMITNDIKRQQLCINITKSVYLPLNEQKCILNIDDCGVL